MSLYLLTILLFLPSLHSQIPPSFYVVCQDYQLLSSYDSLIWPVNDKPIPWALIPSSKVYHSACFRDKFNIFFSRTIPGSNSISFSFFLDELMASNCFYYPHGGFIRDLINAKYPHDLDGQYSCTSEHLQAICDRVFGLGFGYVDKNTSYFFIGNHSLEGFSWNSSFFSLEDQEYTPDSLYYDPLNEVLIDLSGKGFEDVKKSQIRIPVERNNWDRWLIKNTSNSFMRTFALRKVPRYWKLKEIGFQDYDFETISYLKRKIVKLWENNNYPMKNAFMLHICWILDGVYQETGGRICVPREKAFAEQNINKCKSFVSLIMEDFCQMPGKILKDIQLAIQDTGCFLGKNFDGWGKALFIFGVFFVSFS